MKTMCLLMGLTLLAAACEPPRATDPPAAAPPAAAPVDTAAPADSIPPAETATATPPSRAVAPSATLPVAGDPLALAENPVAPDAETPGGIVPLTETRFNAITAQRITPTPVVQYEVSVDALTPGGPEGRPDHGYLAQPVGVTPLGAVAIVPGMMGDDELVRQQAREMAGAGWMALVVDPYKGQHPANPGEASSLARNLRRAEYTETLEAARTWLADSVSTRPLPVGVVGYGLHAKTAIDFASEAPELKALVLFEGGPGAVPGRLRDISCPVLAFFSANDPYLTEAKLEGFKRMATSFGVDYTDHRYDAHPGFTIDPEDARSESYCATARRRALDFIAAHAAP